MFVYKSEILVTTYKWFRETASEEDAENLDELINNRVSEGWEFVCHSYMPTVTSGRSAILVTFRKEK